MRQEASMDIIHTVVAGVSRPTRDDPALIVAVELAREAGAALHVVHAYEVPHLHTLPHPGVIAEYEAELRAALCQAADERCGAHDLCHVVHGAPARALLRVADEVQADLVVVGAGEHPRLLASTAERVLREADVPVFVVRRPVRRPLERVLIATDLLEVSAAAHERGLDVAAAAIGAPEAVRSLLVVGAGALPAPLTDAALGRTARAELRRFLTERRPRAVRVQAAVRTGAPAREIIAEAEAWKADLLVMGTHGHVLLGSVAETAAHGAPCNVLAVPPGPSGGRIMAPETTLDGWRAELHAAPGREAAIIQG
jgi:nucleotide-binding universal stress UspA family protein